MKVLVAIKRVVDYKAVIRIKADGSGVDKSNVKLSMNPFDEIAVEEAIRLKEQQVAKEVIAICIGNDSCQETLRTALAMGADKAILLKTDEEILPLTAAKCLQTIAEQEKPDLIILGKQAIDTDNNQVGQMLAARLNWPQGTFASKLDFHDQGVSVTREVDGGLETLFLTLPAVITTDLRLNEPRYISLPNIVQAKRKPLTVQSLTDLNLTADSHQTLLKVVLPEKKRAAKQIETVAELVECLKNEVRVL